MDASNSSFSNYSSFAETSSNSTVTAKLRRLKIQEDLLLQNIRKSVRKHGGENDFFKSCSEFKKYTSTVECSYDVINNLYGDVKSTTISDHYLKTSDINDIKKEVLDLEEKIKSFKTFLQRESLLLKQEENEILRELNSNTDQCNKIRKMPRINTKNYSDIIPSPVRNLINSPFQCSEVQQYHDFLATTAKYGGWNEYNHNLFVKIWQKQFVSEDYPNMNNLEPHEFDMFVNEVVEKATGIKKSDVLSHIKWYSKYSVLKECKQRAIDEWKTKNRTIKAPHRCKQSNKESIEKKSEKIYTAPNNLISGMSNKYDTKRKFKKFLIKIKHDQHAVEDLNWYHCNEDNEPGNNTKNRYDYSKNTEPILTFAKPTKQWNNRCKLSNNNNIFNNNLEDLKKLGIPEWRLVTRT